MHYVWVELTVKTKQNKEKQKANDDRLIFNIFSRRRIRHKQSRAGKVPHLFIVPDPLSWAFSSLPPAHKVDIWAPGMLSVLWKGRNPRPLSFPPTDFLRSPPYGSCFLPTDLTVSLCQNLVTNIPGKLKHEIGHSFCVHRVTDGRLYRKLTLNNVSCISLKHILQITCRWIKSL